jgi:hypothetical protein
MPAVVQNKIKVDYLIGIHIVVIAGVRQIVLENYFVFFAGAAASFDLSDQIGNRRVAADERSESADSLEVIVYFSHEAFIQIKLGFYDAVFAYIVNQGGKNRVDQDTGDE